MDDTDRTRAERATRLLAMGLAYTWLTPPIALREAATSLRIAYTVQAIVVVALLLGAALG